MRARQVSEEEAFAVLRAASMHSNRRVGQVSQQVIAAAHYADAVNRAGKLRMLSQRLVKAVRSRVLDRGVRTAGRAARRRGAADRCHSSARSPGACRSRPSATCSTRCSAAWADGRRRSPRPRSPPAGSAELDAAAEQLLLQAEQLTAPARDRRPGDDAARHQRRRTAARCFAAPSRRCSAASRADAPREPAGDDLRDFERTRAGAGALVRSASTAPNSRTAERAAARLTPPCAAERGDVTRAMPQLELHERSSPSIDRAVTTSLMRQRRSGGFCRRGRGACRGSRARPCGSARSGGPRPARRGCAAAAGRRAGSRRSSPPGRWSSSRCGPTAAPPRRRRASPSPPCCGSRATISSSSSCRWARVSASSAPNGSSISSTFGSIASARAMPTRCFMPPEISCGPLVRGVRQADQRERRLGAGLQLRLASRSRRTRARPRGRRSRSRSARAAASGSGTPRARSGPGPAISRLAQSSTPLRRLRQAGDQVQQRRLAAARVADQRDELALARP